MMKKLLELYHKYEELVNYVIVGGLTTLVSWIVYFGSVLTFLDAENAIQLQIAKAVVAVQKHVDGLVDAASELEKASEALRKALAN